MSSTTKISDITDPVARLHRRANGRVLAAAQDVEYWETEQKRVAALPGDHRVKLEQLERKLTKLRHAQTQALEELSALAELLDNS